MVAHPTYCIRLLSINFLETALYTLVIIEKTVFTYQIGKKTTLHVILGEQNSCQSCRHEVKGA